MAYSSSLTDSEWEIIEPLLLEALPQKKKTRPLDWSYRDLMDGIFYRLKNGCNWGDLPKDLPPYSTVYWHYKQWRDAGTLEILMTILHEQVRAQVKKKPQWTTLIIIDSQAVKNTCNASVDSKGFCFYKATNGIKRHLAVDILGFPFFTLCTPANVSDDAGLIEFAHAKHGLFSGKAREYSEDYHHAGPGVSPGQIGARTEKGVSPNHAENQIRAVAETLQSREGGGRSNWLCPRCRPVG